jgi:hypothetical protein
MRVILKWILKKYVFSVDWIHIAHDTDYGGLL